MTPQANLLKSLQAILWSTVFINIGQGKQTEEAEKKIQKVKTMKAEKASSKNNEADQYSLRPRHYRKTPNKYSYYKGPSKDPYLRKVHPYPVHESK